MDGLMLLATIVEEQARKRRRIGGQGLPQQELEPMDASPSLSDFDTQPTSSCQQVGSLWGWAEHPNPEQLADDADSGSDSEPGSPISGPTYQTSAGQSTNSFPGFWVTYKQPVPAYQDVQS